MGGGIRGFTVSAPFEIDQELLINKTTIGENNITLL